MDLISRQDAIDLVRNVCDAIMSCCGSHYDEETKDEVYDDVREVDAILKCNKEIRIALKNMPSAQPTLHGYNIEHLELIAIVLQKEDLPPERIVEALTDIGRIVAIVRDEFEETLRRAVQNIERRTDDLQ